MADRSSVFPIYIRAETDNQSMAAFSRFETEAGRAALRARAALGPAFDDIGTRIQKALSIPTNALGGLDLQSGKLREAADAAARQAQAMREVARVAKQVAASDPSPAFIRQAREASSAATTMEQFSRATAAEALALDRLEQELAQTAIGTNRLASAQKGFTGSLGAQRAAYVQTGQQLQDIIISLGSGQRASTVLAQQLPQLAFALQGAGGAAGRVASIFAGPWGVALAAGAFALGPLIDNLFGTAKAADEAKFATNAMSDAQSILGNVMDLTTGKINTQIPALLALAKAQILVAQVQAQTRAAEARRGVQDIQYRETQFSGGIGGGFSIRRRPIDARDTISQQVLAGTLDASKAVDRLKNLRDIGRLTDEQFAAAATSVANLGVELQNAKVFAEAEKLLAGTGGRSLLKPAKVKKERAGRKGDGGAASLAEFGEDAGKRIANLVDQFGDAPSAVTRVSKALRELDDIQSDLERRKPAGVSKLLADLKDARGVVESSLGKPYRDLLQTAREQEEVDQRLINGREIEAEILERALQFKERNQSLSEKEAEALARIVIGEKLRAIEIEKQGDVQRRNLALLDDTQANLRQTVNELFRGKGFDAVGNLFERQFDSYIDGLSDQLSEALFGDVFREQKLKLLGLDKVEEAGKTIAKSIVETSNQFDRLKEAAAGAARALGGGMPANDNPASIPSTADKPIGVEGRPILSTRELLKALGTGIFGEKVADQIGKAVEDAYRGAAYGQLGGGLLQSVGIKTSTSGSQIGGALGGKVGEKFLSKGLESLAKGLGDFAGPLGSIAGGIIGGLVGGLFKKTPKGSTSISSIDGDLGYTGSGKLKSGVLGLGGSVQSSLANIIETLGGTAGSFGVSVGQRGKNFVVDPTGRGRTKGSGVLKFKDEADAARAALLDAINDGAVQGIRQGAQNLLRAGKDIDKQLQKAADFQSVFDRLREREDPTGAALDKLDREFGRLKNIFAEAGASAAEYADLERLYGLERADAIKEANERVTSSLKGLYDELTAGNDNRSLKERQAFALAQYDPLRARVAAGDKSAYDDFAEISRTLLDIERQIFGSQSGYFSRLDEITGLTKSRIDSESNVALLSTNRDGLFGSASPANDTGAVMVGAIQSQTTSLLAALNQANTINAYNGQLLERLAANGGRSFALNGQTYF